MDFSLEYTEEQEAYAVEVRAWLDENVPDGLEHIRDTRKMNDEQWQLRRDFTRVLGKKGWLYPNAPKAYGGGGLSGDQSGVLSTELGKRGLALTPLYDMGVLVSPAIMAVGTEEQKQRFLPPIFTGELLTWQLFTEPEAGTDAANQQTEALRSERDGDHFIVNGHKVFVGSYPTKPEQLYLLTRSDPDAPRHQNLTSFLIPANLPGITVQALDLFPLSTFPSQWGVTGANVEAVKHAVYFDNVRIHESRVIAEEGLGWAVTTATLEVEHGGSGGRRKRAPISPAQAAAAAKAKKAPGDQPPRKRYEELSIGRNHLSEKFFEQCRTDPRVKRRLEENPQLQDSVLEIYIGTQTNRLWSMRNANGMGGAYGGPQLSLFGKMLGTTFTKHMAKVLGPAVYTDDPEWVIDDGRFETAQRCGICLAPGGTPESYKINISRALNMGRK
ncbi:MAG: acyl-CoA dehydrogenase family protein [Desulfobacterales bacterium]